MKELNTTLQTFWSSFRSGNTVVPAFLAGHVPRSQTFPYITYEAAQASPIGTTILTACNWHRIGDAGIGPANLERADLMDAIAASIPPEGVIIQTGENYIGIYRNDTDFQTYLDDPEDVTVIGGRTSYEIHFYY